MKRDSEKLLNDLSVLDRTDFIYKGELYDTSMEDWTHNSIGYIPDLVSLVVDYSGIDDDYEACLLDFIQDDLCRDCKTDKEYAAAVKYELLDNTDLM